MFKSARDFYFKHFTKFVFASYIGGLLSFVFPNIYYISTMFVFCLVNMVVAYNYGVFEKEED